MQLLKRFMVLRSGRNYVILCAEYISTTISIACVHILSQNQTFYRRIIGLASLTK